MTFSAIPDLPRTRSNPQPTDSHEKPTLFSAARPDVTGVVPRPAAPSAVVEVAARDIVEAVPAPLAIAPPAAKAPERARLEDLFKEPELPQRKRALPKKAKVVMLAGGAVLLLALAAGRRGKPTSASPVADAVPAGAELVVDEADLKRRREVSPADFHSRARASVPAGPPPTSSDARLVEGEAASTDESMDARRARREGRAARSAPAPAEAPGPRPRVAAGELGLWDRELSLAPDDPSAKPVAAQGPDHPKRDRKLAPVGATIPATLTVPLVVGGSGSATAVAEVEEDGVVPAGTRFLGTATLEGDRVEIRFRGAVLPDGNEVRLRGEAQDSSGEFGVAVSLPTPKGPGREVAEDTALDVGLGALGGGVLGSAARSYADRRSREGDRWQRPSVKVPSGTQVIVFLQEAAVLRATD